MSIRAEIACSICGNDTCNHKPLEPPPTNTEIMCPENLSKADQILTYLKAEIEKCLLTDGETEKAFRDEWRVDFRELLPSCAARNAVAQAQVKKAIELLEEK